MEFKFCPFCGSPLQKRVDDGRKRLYCGRCNKIHCRNSTIGVAVILMKKDELLL